MGSQGDVTESVARDSIIRTYAATRLLHSRVKPRAAAFETYRAKRRDIFCCNVNRVTPSVKDGDELSAVSLTNEDSA